MIEDLNLADPGPALDCEICIVGSGPAGLAIALEFVGKPERVIVLESGGDSYEPEIEGLSTFENVGQKRAQASATRRRIFGGTSSVWSGRCTPFSPLDLQTRAWIPDSGWPIDVETVAPFLDRAGKVLQTGPSVYDDRIWSLLGASPPSPPWDASRFEAQVFQASVVKHPRTRVIPLPSDPGSAELHALQHSNAPQAEDIAEFSRESLRESSNVRVLLHAHATEILTGESGDKVAGVSVRIPGGRTLTVRSHRVVLACGAIDNARLLLLSRSRHPAGLGNDHDQVGRYLLDHHYAPVASFIGSQAPRLRRRMGLRWLDVAGSRYTYVMGASLSAQQQREQGLPRATLYTFERIARKPALRSLGHIISGPKSGPDAASQGDWSNVLLHPMEIASGARDRYLRKLPPLAPVTHLDIGCNVEQIPNQNSRVTLGSGRDSMGQPIARLDWRLDQREYETYCYTARLLVQECARLGLEVPQITEWARGKDTQWASSLHDMAHPMCTTRMSDNPRRGVVDSNCAVHGVDGLYVAGGSVFSTGGTSNPTLMAVSLAIRLADHLGSRSDAAADITPGPRIESMGTSRLRVGIVGAGHRIRDIHGPVLAALSDTIEVTGFVGRREESIARVTSELGWAGFQSIDSLLAAQRPDFLIVAVSDSANAHVMRHGLALGLPVLGETPLAWSEKEARSLVQLARARRLPFGIAEQFPFLPAEQLKAKLISLGVIGPVVSCCNDFATYSYHGVAQLRAYMGYGRRPLAVRARTFRFGRTGTPEGQEPATPALAPDETWTLATIETDGGLMEYRYSDGYVALPTRPKGQLRILGQSGSIVDERVITVDRVTGASLESTFTRAGRAISIEHPALGTIDWRYPRGTEQLSDEQVAVWSHIDTFCRAARFGGAPLYMAAQALDDVEIVRAMGYSDARDGAHVALPLRPELEKLRAGLRKLRRRQE
jgi:choline dehydrogenase-like flavoprotein